jgi:predicted nucleotidyltransferase component of viral defense system
VGAARASHQPPQEFQIVTNEQLRPAVARRFGDEFLAREVAFRGGTALHDLHLDPPGRYSEDIDLVQVDAGPIGPVMDAVRARLDP